MAGLPNAVVTLLTAPSYLPGALVLLHSLQELHPAPRDFKLVCLVTPETVDAHAIGALRNAGYDLVIGVEPIASGDSGQDGLDLMGRPDLTLALTKLHIFRLGSLFSTILYLDADTLPLRPLDHLFDATAPHHFSACPDVGWPDCFNSGVMVIRPGPTDFDDIRETLRNNSTDGSGNGSFDGADQGLLNQYFSDEGRGGAWHRLPFTYNVTPSAAYQYAPAYKHYANKINLVHFIGATKPWSTLAHRPAGSSASSNGSSFDYGALVDRWYAIYDRHVRPTAVHAPNLAKRFSVPEHQAVWNQSTVDQPNDRLDLGVLKSAVEQGMATLRPGQYTSLPLDGRVDLIRPKPVPKETPKPFHPWFNSVPATTGPNEHEGSHPTHLSDVHHQPVSHGDNQEYPPYLQPVFAQPAQRQPEHHHQPHEHHYQSHEHHHQPHEHHHQPHEHHHQTHEHHEEPPKEIAQHDAWDASHQAPPKYSRPEMAVAIDTHYSPAWDQPVSAHATYFQTHPEPSTPAYPSIPRNVLSNDWYKEFTGTTPKQDNVKPVFPWEASTRRPPPGRIFPKPKEPVLAARAPRQTSLQINTSTNQPPPAAKPAPRAEPANFVEAMASYTNAWDNVASIDRYAKRLTVLGIGIERRSNSGLQTVPPSPHRSSVNLAAHHTARGDSSSDGSDGDDEGEEPQYRYPSNILYRDKQAQTERPSMADAKVQASPESSPGTSPTLDAKALPPVKRQLPISQFTPASRHSDGSGRKPKATPAPTNYQWPTTSTAPRPTPSGGRTWDPRTDLNAVKKNSQLMLNRFVKTADTEPAA